MPAYFLHFLLFIYSFLDPFGDKVSLCSPKKWWCIPVILVLRSLRQKDLAFRAMLGCLDLSPKQTKASRTLMKTLFKAVETGIGPVAVRKEDSVPSMIQACKSFS